MNHDDNQEKIELFNEFFTIDHQFSVNICAINDQQVNDYEEFLSIMPTPFKMLSEMASIDQSALRPLQALSGVANQLVNYLNHQAQKIDLLVGYILSQQDDPNARFQGVSFGGGGISFISDKAFELNELVELKIFMQSENCALYSHGEIIDIEQKDGNFNHKVLFHYIRDEDREILVRASLHKQSRQLQELAKQRQQNKSS